MNYTRFFLCIAAASVLFASCKSSTQPSNSQSYTIVPPSDTIPRGHTWDYWTELWDNWKNSTYPNPLPVQAKADSSNGIVWFNAAFNIFGQIHDSTTGEKKADTSVSITISSNDALFFRVLQQTYFNSGDNTQGALDTDAMIIQAGYPTPLSAWGATWQMRIGTITVDGQSVANLPSYYHYTKSPFIIHVLNPAYYGTMFPYPNDHTKYDACAGMVALFLDHFSKGDHTILQQQNNGKVLTNVTWTVHVQ